VGAECPHFYLKPSYCSNRPFSDASHGGGGRAQASALCVVRRSIPTLLIAVRATSIPLIQRAHYTAEHGRSTQTGRIYSLVHARPQGHRASPRGRRARPPAACGRAVGWRRRIRRAAASAAPAAAAAALLSPSVDAQPRSRHGHVDARRKCGAQREDGGAAACGRGSG
jgi:hypothetical protein